MWPSNFLRFWVALLPGWYVSGAFGASAMDKTCPACMDGLLSRCDWRGTGMADDECAHDDPPGQHADRRKVNPVIFPCYMIHRKIGDMTQDIEPKADSAPGLCEDDDSPGLCDARRKVNPQVSQDGTIRRKPGDTTRKIGPREDLSSDKCEDDGSPAGHRDGREGKPQASPDGTQRRIADTAQETDPKDNCVPGQCEDDDSPSRRGNWWKVNPLDPPDDMIQRKNGNTTQEIDYRATCAPGQGDDDSPGQCGNLERVKPLDSRRNETSQKNGNTTLEPDHKTSCAPGQGEDDDSPGQCEDRRKANPLASPDGTIQQREGAMTHLYIFESELRDVQITDEACLMQAGGESGRRPAGQENPGRSVRARSSEECRQWVREALDDFRQLTDQGQGLLARGTVALQAQRGGPWLTQRLMNVFGTCGASPAGWPAIPCGRGTVGGEGGMRRPCPGLQGPLPYGIFHASHLWANGSWSTDSDLVALGRTDLLPGSEAPTSEMVDPGIRDTRVMPERVLEEEQEEDDGSGLFQVTSRLVPSWEALIERLGRWWDEGRQVAGAVAMVRAIARNRQEHAYGQWLRRPLESLNVGFGDGTWMNTDRTPPDFYEWALEIEHILHRCFLTTTGRPAVRNSRFRR